MTAGSHGRTGRALSGAATASNADKDARQAETDALKAKAFDLWLNCLDVREIEAEIEKAKSTVDDWLSEMRKSAEFGQPPGQTDKDPKKPGYWGSVQHFDVWAFQNADKEEPAMTTPRYTKRFRNLAVRAARLGMFIDLCDPNLDVPPSVRGPFRLAECMCGGYDCHVSGVSLDGIEEQLTQIEAEDWVRCPRCDSITTQGMLDDPPFLIAVDPDPDPDDGLPAAA